MLLFPVERLVLGIILTLATVSSVLLWQRGVDFHLPSIALGISCGAGLVAAGQVYRRMRREPPLAHAMTAIGLFILFSLAGAIANYVFLPISVATIDPLLFRVDAALGYDWVAAVSYAAARPWIGALLYVVYSSSLLQLMFVHCWWGFREDVPRLHHLMLTGILAALISIAFWGFFPSFGPSAYVTLPDWIEAAIPMSVTPAYGLELLHLAAEGPRIINPQEMFGLIAMPSVHIVMACLAVVFAPGWLPARVLFYAINLVMVPATLVQGGHHLIDVAGGIVVFAIAWLIAGALVRRLGTTAPHAAPLSPQSA